MIKAPGMASLAATPQAQRGVGLRFLVRRKSRLSIRHSGRKLDDGSSPRLRDPKGNPMRATARWNHQWRQRQSYISLTLDRLCLGLAFGHLARLLLPGPNNLVRAPPHPIGPDELPFRLEFSSACVRTGNRKRNALVFNEPVDDESPLCAAGKYGVDTRSASFASHQLLSVARRVRNATAQLAGRAGRMI